MAEFDQKQAEMIGRQLNQAFSNTTGYGPGHPITKRTLETVVDLIREAQKSIPSLTLLLDRDALFIEQHVVDRKFNAKRLITVFKKIGLQSVTIDPGITTSDIDRLMVVLSDNNQFPSIESAKTELERFRITTLKLNYVMFKKVTADEAVVGKGGLDELTAQAALAVEQQASGAPAGDEPFLEPSPDTAALPATAAQPDPGRQFISLENDVMSKISAVFSLKELFQNPDRVADNLVAASEGMSDEAKSKLVGQIRQATRQVEQTDPGQSAVSLGELMESLAVMRHDLKDGISAQKQVGRLLTEEGTILSEIDLLTYRAIVKLVREEYRGGSLSIKRLAQIIRRMLPESRDLKRLLPQLKDALVSEGMPITEYIKLVNELTAELQSEGLSEALVEGAEDIGLTVDDIVREIKANPRETARLVVLAAELKQGTHGDELALSTVLTDYVERISGRMALESPESASREGGRSLRNVIHRIEKELVERLKGQGLASAVIAKVERGLSERFQDAVSGVKAEWLNGVLERAQEIGGTLLMESLESVLDRQTELQSMESSMRSALEAQGYTEEQIRDIYAQLAQRIKSRSQMFLLPRSVLTPNNTTYFLQREIKSCIRYKTPFSSLTISFPAARKSEDGPWFAPTPQQMTLMMPEIFKVLTARLRDLDFVGSFGNLEKTIPFVILPMTEEPGAEVVRGRLETALREAAIPLEGATANVNAVVSATGFDRTRTPDLKTFLQLVKDHHSAAEQASKVPLS